LKIRDLLKTSKSTGILAFKDKEDEDKNSVIFLLNNSIYPLIIIFDSDFNKIIKYLPIDKNISKKDTFYKVFISENTIKYILLSVFDFITRNMNPNFSFKDIDLKKGNNIKIEDVETDELDDLSNNISESIKKIIDIKIQNFSDMLEKQNALDMLEKQNEDDLKIPQKQIPIIVKEKSKLSKEKSKQPPKPPKEQKQQKFNFDEDVDRDENNLKIVRIIDGELFHSKNSKLIPIKRKAIVNKKGSRYPTGIMGVSFHYACAKNFKIKDQINNFSFRAQRKALTTTNNPIKIPTKDFEFNDIGLIMAAFYLDFKTKTEDYDVNWKLIFPKEDYDFIYKYGAKNWVKITKFKSVFKYEENVNMVLEKNYESRFYKTIENSFSRSKSIDASNCEVPEEDKKIFQNKYLYIPFEPEFKYTKLDK